MSRNHRFAVDLQYAFLKARGEYLQAYSAYESARLNRDRTKNAVAWLNVCGDVNSKEAEQARNEAYRAEAVYSLAVNKWKAADSAWIRYDEAVKAITEELNAADHGGADALERWRELVRLAEWHTARNQQNGQKKRDRMQMWEMDMGRMIASF